jgi:hypothetical protein
MEGSVADEAEEGEGLQSVQVYLQRIARDARETLLLQRELVRFHRDAEQEIPESMRRFVTYMHDIHDITYMYEERGLVIPDWIKEELQRCDDRFRQLLKVQHSDGKTFEKVRREMTEDAENRWDHTKQLSWRRHDARGV